MPGIARTDVRYSEPVAVYQASLLAAGVPGVDTGAAFERIELDATAWVDIARGWLRGPDTLFDDLVQHVDWHQGKRWMYERVVDDPRLSCWFPAGEPVPHPALHEARAALESQYGVPLGGAGLNYYRDGNDSVAFHRDRELREVDDAIVAIVTLGSTRPFLLRPRGKGTSLDLSPGRGDLVVMGGSCQRDWEHGVPKSKRGGPRLSMSWRWSGRNGPVLDRPRATRTTTRAAAPPAQPAPATPSDTPAG
ncbi:MAG: alpha-ketoglutarate-dependent dioxygenase AlkB [Actinobacteria bacterium]|nr:alpha-ketoglutarate-dependent dioxygenase AlkB [Actinomycetota bacterium]